MKVKKYISGILFIVISLLLVGGVLVVIFPTSNLFFSWSSSYGFQIMLLYLLAGFFFMLLKQPRLMAVSFLCCAVLTLYLKYNSHTSINNHKKQSEIIKVGHFNISNSNEGEDLTVATLEKCGADILSVHEISPNWQEYLNIHLKDTFPYSVYLPDVGIFGQAIFSRTKLYSLDTFYFNEIPNAIFQADIQGKKINLISVHTYPALNKHFFKKLVQHLDLLAENIKKCEGPVFSFGDFHTVGWSDEIQHFRDKTNLHDSRMGYSPTYPHGSLTFLEVPIDHIFYSSHFECTDFKTISGFNTRHLGIMASFKIKQDSTNVKKAH